MGNQVDDISRFKQETMALLKDPDLDAELKKFLTEKLFEERNQQRTASLSQKQFWHNTPLVVALVGTITIGANLISNLVSSNDSAQNTERLKVIESQLTERLTLIESQLAEESKSKDASRDATKEERAFAYKIIEQELAKSQGQEERAKVLLFLVRAGVLNSLDKVELEKMALADLSTLGKGEEAVGIPPTVGADSVGPVEGAVKFDQHVPLSGLLGTESNGDSMAAQLSTASARGNLARTLVSVLQELKCFDLIQEGYRIQVIVLRDVRNRELFADQIVVLSKSEEGEEYTVQQMSAMARPHGRWLKNPVDSQGAAMIVGGHYSYAVGVHRRGGPNSYETLVQVGSVFINRVDSELNSQMSTVGIFGLNFVRDDGSGAWGSGTILVKENAQTQDFSHFMALVKEAQAEGQIRFPVTVIEVDR